MRIIPVIDLKQGVVVRGVAGRRAEYQPISSRIAAGAAPGDVARAFVQNFAFRTVYVADLDAIAGGACDLRAYAQIAAAGLSMWIDAGVADVSQATALAACQGVAAVVIGLESLLDAASLKAMIAALGSERVIFSLDLFAGRPRTLIDAWTQLSPEAIASRVASLGIGRMIVLDLADVGLEHGTSTLALARQIRRELPDVRLIGGGGVRGTGDLVTLAAAGYEGALVASALHDGRIMPQDVASLDLP